MKTNEIKIKLGINPRKELRSEIIEHYINIFDVLPPVVVQKNTGVLIDGFHRIEAARFLQREDIEVEAIEVEDNDLFAEACRRNSTHGLALSRDERNEAIVKLYRDGWTQEALGQMWSVSQQQISNIVGADKRTENLQLTCKTSEKLLPSHEELIRRAPEPFRDEIAKIVLTREGKKGQPKPLRLSETNSLVKVTLEKDEVEAREVLAKMQAEPHMRIVGTDDSGNVDEQSVSELIRSVKNAHTIDHDWYTIITAILDYKVKYLPEKVSEFLRPSEGIMLEGIIDYLDEIAVLTKMKGGATSSLP